MPLNESQTFLRWAGGKQRVVSRFRRFAPATYAKCVYHEPFVGAGSMFLSLKPRRAHLSDINEDLINVFRFVRDEPELISRYLARHARLDSHDHYYEVREKYNASARYSCARAARFIYLNRTCFNGIFRVNRQGDFNVPYGKLTSPLFPSLNHLKNISRALRKTRLRAEPFGPAMRRARAGHFVYLDPPYPQLNGTSFFQHYTPQLFGESQQIILRDEFERLDRRGCLLMVSNADTPFIRGLYHSFKVFSLPVTRFVSSKRTKKAVSELIITNYSVESDGL